MEARGAGAEEREARVDEDADDAVVGGDDGRDAAQIVGAEALGEEAVEHAAHDGVREVQLLDLAREVGDGGEGDGARRVLAPVPEGLVAPAGRAEAVERDVPRAIEGRHGEGGLALGGEAGGEDAGGAGELEADVEDAAQRLGADLERLLRGVVAAQRAIDVGAQQALVLARVVELALDELGGGFVADPLDALGGVRLDAVLERLFDVVEEDGAERAELARDDVDLAHEGLEHAVLGALGIDEVVAAHLRLGLERAVDAAVALLEARGVPRQIEVEEVGAAGLEVDALARGVGGHEDAQRLFVEGRVEAALHLLARVVAHAALEGGDAVLGGVGVGDGLAEELDQVALRVRPLGEDQDAAIEPVGALRGRVAEARADVPAQPREERAHLGVGHAAGALGLGAQLDEEGARLFGRRRERRAGLGELGVGLGLQGLVGRAVGLGIGEGIEGELGRESDGTAALLERARVDLEAPGEGLGAREQALLEADEREAARTLLGRAELGVAGEEARELEVERIGGALFELEGVAAGGARGPAGAIVLELDLDQNALGEALDAELAQIALEAAHHDRREVVLAAHRDAAGEADGVEQLEERAEAVGVAVVRGRAEEEAVVEAGREIADGVRDLAVDRVAAAGGRRGDVGLVEDEQALLGARAEVLAQGLAVLGAAQERVRDDEAVMGGPRVHAEAALLAALRDELSRHHLEVETEAAAHLALPLKADGRGAGDEDEVGLLAEDQLLEDEAGLDRLSEAHVIGDEEVGARELERLHQRGELMGHVFDARAERRLEARGVCRAHRVPAQRVEVRAEVGRRVEAIDRAEGVGLGLDDLGAELEIPEDVEGAAGIVVVEADEVDERGLVALARAHVLDEPLAMARADDLAGARQAVAMVGGQRRLGAAGIEAGGEEEALEEIAAGGRGVGDGVGAADGLELFAAELAQERRDAELGAEEARELVFGGAVPGAQAHAEEAREIEDARLRERAEDRRSAGRRGEVGGRCHRVGAARSLGPVRPYGAAVSRTR